MRYVLLLRGINVGGRNRVVMQEFRQRLQCLGFGTPETYLNSGNVFMSSDAPKDEVALRVNDVLRSDYDFPIPFALLTSNELRAESASFPSWWSEPLARRDALFPVEGTDFAAIKADVADMPLGNEVIHFGERVILWGKRSMTTYGRTAYHRLLIKRPYYRKLTIRNGNTLDQIVSRL